MEKPADPEKTAMPRQPTGDPLLDLAGTLKNAFSEGADEFVREIRREKDDDSVRNN